MSYYRLCAIIRGWWYYWTDYLPFRLWHGWDKRDCWGLDTSCSKWLLPRLRHLKKVKHGSPIDGDECKTHEDWDRILDQIIYAHEFAANHWEPTDVEAPDPGGLDEPAPPEFWAWCKYRDHCAEKAQEGLRLFAKYYGALWD